MHRFCSSVNSGNIPAFWLMPRKQANITNA